MAFDYRMLCAELQRINLRPPHSNRVFCTMQAYQRYHHGSGNNFIDAYFMENHLIVVLVI